MNGRIILAALLAVVAVSLSSSPWGMSAADPDEQWITVNKDYSSQRYVDLDQITPANVSDLRPICEIDLNQPTWFSSGLVMVNRTIYVTTMLATYAIDATNCTLRWQTPVKIKQPRSGSMARGVAYLDGMVFRGTVDGRMIALDARTGKLVWEAHGANPADRESFGAAPVAWQGKVFTGMAVSDRGIQGRLMAYDAKTGRELWRFNTTLDDIGPPFKAGRGGGFWTSFSLDPATGEVFGPVANPFPDYTLETRPPGTDLYTNSVISVNAITGQLNWYYQAVPRDDHDWDLGTPPTLYRTPGGRSMLAIAGKNGRVYGIDRASRSLVFNTPATTILDDDVPVDLTPRLVCPGVIGGAQFNGTAYHPGLGTLYVGMVDWCFHFWRNATLDPDPKAEDPGGQQRPDYSVRQEARPGRSAPPSGRITAIEGETGRVLWTYRADAQVQAGLVPTKSGLLFAGDVKGHLLALDARTGAELHRLDVRGALNHGLISYALDGQQYVAAAVGGATLNSAGVAGPVRVSLFGLSGRDRPKVVRLNRLVGAPTGDYAKLANFEMYSRMCGPCHGPDANGDVYPSLLRNPQVAEPGALRHFLATVPPPMPRLYPGLLEEKEIRMIAEHLKKAVFKCDEGNNCKPPVKPRTGGTAEWRAIYSVLTHPRCLNCHPATSASKPDTDFPRQADDRHPHLYGIVRGIDDRGAIVAKCDSCHGPANNPATGVPGAKDHLGNIAWHLAPKSMAWETTPGNPMNGTELCAALKKSLRPRDLLHHVATEPLVLWAWNPGTRLDGEARTTPSRSHGDFVKTFTKWVNEGAPCPTE